MINKIAFLLLFLVLASSTVGAVPTATLSANPPSGFSPLEVTFSGDCMDDTSTIVSCTIDFGDGSATVDFNKREEPYTYYTRDTYDVNLFALNSEDESRNTIVQVTVLNQVPEAALDVSPNSGNPPLTVTFTGFCSDPDGNSDLASCEIDFDDGNTGINFEDEMPHTYFNTNTYIVKLTATDSQSAEHTESETINITAAIAPSITNKLPSGYVNVALPTISFDVNDSGSGINIDSLALFADNVGITPKKDKVGDNYHVSWTFGDNLSSGHTVHVGLRVEDSQGNSTGDVSWSFTVDTEAPNFDNVSVPAYTNDTTPSISIENATGSPSHMAFSCNGTDWKEWQSYATTISDFTITSSSFGCLNGSQGTVSVHVKLKDSAGNVSGSKSRSTVYDYQAPNTPTLNEATPYNGAVRLEWSGVSDNGPSGLKEYIIYRGNSEVTTTGSTAYTVSGLNNGTTYYFRIRARDNAGNVSSYSNERSAAPSGSGSGSDDDTPPYLSWELPRNNSTVRGIVTLKVQSYDDESSVRFVKFFVDNTPIETDYAASGERYSVDWNSMKIANGSHTLKAIAKNRSGDLDNETTIETITVRTDNDIVFVSDEGSEEAKAAIDAADDAKEDCSSVLAEFNKIGISASSAALGLLSDGSNLLDGAQDLLDDADYDEAEEKANEAKEKLDEMLESVSIEDYGQRQSYVYNDQHLAVLLQGLGMKQELREEAIALVQGNTVNRGFTIKKVSDGEETYYKAVVSVSIRNDSPEPKTFNVIEIVPKEFAENAFLLYAEGSTEIVADPIIQWSVSLEPGAKEEIVYALYAQLSKDEADALLVPSILYKFDVPPLLVKEDTVVGEESFSEEEVVSTGLFSLGNLVGTIGWIVLILIVIAVVFFAFKQYSGGEKESPTGLGAVIQDRDSGKRVFGRIGFGKKESEERKPKWAYKD